MYAQFFGLRQEPFSIAPDPRYLFMSERHREALAHLLYGLRGGGGFVLLSGEIGAGKTTVCRCFLEQVPNRCNVAYIFNPKLTVTELLKSVCDEFGVPCVHHGEGDATVKDYVDVLNEFLLRTHAVGQNNVLIIDEAQNLSADVLEQLRLLTNLETNERKLLQIVLIGQPELRAMLARPELEQLAQRVVARFHLGALSEDETAQYVQHRLSIAGMTQAIPFDRKALRRIHRLSRGVPRRINLLCDRALLGAYAGGMTSVERRIVDQAASEVFDQGPQHRSRRLGRATFLAVGVLAVGAAALGAFLAFDGSFKRSVAPGKPAAAVPAPRVAAAASTAGASPVTASAASPALPPPTPPVQSLSDLKSFIRSESQAWRELASAWQLSLGDEDPCQAAHRQDVHCYKSSGSSLALLRQLGRPGILTLHDDSDKPAYAVLTGLANDNATLRIGNATHTVSLLSLADSWRGDFATFWRAPPGYAGHIAEGETGPLADWLAARLASWPGAAGTDRAASLKSRIQWFQLAQGLKPDGLAGPITLMHLNRATGVDEPRLQTPEVR